MKKERFDEMMESLQEVLQHAKGTTRTYPRPEPLDMLHVDTLAGWLAAEDNCSLEEYAKYTFAPKPLKTKKRAKP